MFFFVPKSKKWYSRKMSALAKDPIKNSNLNTIFFSFPLGVFSPIFFVEWKSPKNQVFFYPSPIFKRNGKRRG